jgi:alpha-N-arabinofuranosidase
MGLGIVLLMTIGPARSAHAADPVTLTVRADQPGPKLSPNFYGLMTEEINYAYDGGLYAELIRNRIFQDRPNGRRNFPGAVSNPAVDKNPNLVHWWLVSEKGGSGELDIDANDPVNTVALTNSLRLDAKSVGAGQRVGVANDGYWGIPVRRNTEYTASFYARANDGFKGPLKVSIEANAGGVVFASADVPALTSAWKKYTVKLKTEDVQPTADARFVLSTSSPGTLWFSLVSLFPPTYKNRPNGMRVDIMEKLAALHPSFLRFPGGNYLEGFNVQNRFDWKKTLGPIEDRPGHMGPWSYRSTDGVGLLEFLEWCEDLNMEPVVGIYAGLHLDGGKQTITGDALKPYVKEALEEIEYISGDASTPWGARRAKDGHPAPFKLRYVEIGNEDWLNNGKRNYAGRFAMFYDAIKEKHPEITVISSLRSQDHYDHTRQPDLLDDHFYVSIPAALHNAHYYDNYDRKAVKIFAGEWATNSPRGGPVGHMAFALGDAAWLTGLERNGDVVQMNCYAPLFCNVNPGGMQWSINLIGYDAVTSFGSPAYYVQTMFSSNRGSVILPATFDPLPKLNGQQIPQAPSRSGRPTAVPEGAQFDALYVSATREEGSGDIILKIVNVQSEPQQLNIDLKGVQSVEPKANGQVLTAELGAMNSISEPTKVAPKPFTITSAGPRFGHELPGHSVSVIRLKTK